MFVSTNYKAKARTNCNNLSSAAVLWQSPLHIVVSHFRFHPICWLQTLQQLSLHHPVPLTVAITDLLVPCSVCLDLQLALVIDAVHLFTADNTLQFSHQYNP
jgi:hypothetical protein